MNAGDLLTPWVMLAAVLVPLVYVEKWIHSHLYGVGWLLTNDERSATTLYYVLLLPGIFLHEVAQWLVAGAINVDTKSVRIWPEPQKDGTLRLDFVQVKQTNRIGAALIGAAPLIAGLALVWVISNYILNLDDLLTALGTGDLRTISSAIQTLGSKPDFYLWLYLLFAISNAMLPTPSDRQGWPLLVMLFAGIIVFLIIIGTGDRLLETYQDSVVLGLERLTTAFATVLVIEMPAILAIGFSEEILERTTHRKFQYKPPVEIKPRQPGSNEPLAPGEPRPSIYLLELPIPLPPDKPKPRPSASAQLDRRSPLRASAREPGQSPPAAATPSPARASASPRPTESPTVPPSSPRTIEQPGAARPPSVRPAPERTSPGTPPGRPAPTLAQAPTSPTSRVPAQDDSGSSPRQGPTARPTIESRSAAQIGDAKPDDQPGARPDRSAARPTIESRGIRPGGERPATRRDTDEEIRPAAPPDRGATRPEGPRPATSSFSRPAPAQPRSPAADPAGDRPERPARPVDRTSGTAGSAPQHPARPTVERPSLRPAMPTRPSDSAQPDRVRSSRPAPRPGSDEQNAERSPFARPASSQRRDRSGLPGDDNHTTRPSQATSPFIADDGDDNELEYVPFDDVEIPDDDDL